MLVPVGIMSMETAYFLSAAMLILTSVVIAVRRRQERYRSLSLMALAVILVLAGLIAR